MGAVEVRYGQTVTVTNPQNRYENVKFSLSVDFTEAYSDRPDDASKKDIEAWEKRRTDFVNEQVQKLREQVEDQIQWDVTTFIEENS